MDDDMFKRTRLLYDRDDDRISALPDCLILEIVSHLPTTKDAIRTSCLSKRWTSLWTLLPNLVLINDKDTYPDSVCFFSFLDKTITRASRSPLKLNKFQLHSTYYVPEHESQVNTWLRYAINRNVQHLDLTLGFIDFITHIIVLDELLFHNSIFTHLKLACSFVNPTGTFSWINLKSLYISKTDLNEDLLQNILSGSPVLETFTLDNCYGFKQLDITSESVKKLVISGDTSFGGYAQLNAPNILSLKLQGSVILNEIGLGDLSSLVHAHLDYTDDDPRFDYRYIEQDNLVACILSLLHVKELKLGQCVQRFSRFVKLKVSSLHRTSNTLLIMVLEVKRLIDRWHFKFIMLDGLETSYI